MENLTVTLSFKIYPDYNSLPADLQTLVTRADGAAKNAYAPYSLYKVGAALLLADGNIVSANNQENIAYPSGLCAERSAFFYAAGNYPGVAIKAVAVTAITNTGQGVTPCGACRQVMAEYENNQKQPIQLVMPNGKGGFYVAENIASLLPLQFEADGLKKQ